MKAISLLLLVFCTTCFGSWHSWREEEPEEGKLYMWVQELKDARENYVKILWITRYQRDDPKFESADNGWWDVTPREVWKWLHQEDRIIFNP